MSLPITATVLVLVGSGAAACSSSKSGPPTSAPTTGSSPAAPANPYAPSTPSTPSTSPSASGAAALKVGLPKFATALADSAGNALYLYEPDKQGTPTCTGACAAAWPPLTTAGAPTVTGADSAKLGTVTRADGTKQVTYNGWPLYHFVGDKAPGDSNGEGSKAFGGGWYVVGTDGNKIDND